MLVPHAARGGLFLLREPHDLLEVGRAIAADDAARIHALLEAGDLVRPDDEQLGMDEQARFRFVIVQPFVVAQGPLS